MRRPALRGLAVESAGAVEADNECRLSERQPGALRLDRAEAVPALRRELDAGELLRRERPANAVGPVRDRRLVEVLDLKFRRRGGAGQAAGIDDAGRAAVARSARNWLKHFNASKSTSSVLKYRYCASRPQK